MGKGEVVEAALSDKSREFSGPALIWARRTLEHSGNLPGLGKELFFFPI